MSRPTIEYDKNGHLVLRFSMSPTGPHEPICPKCGEPIRWVLDMFSFTTGSFGGEEKHPFTLAHARCVWAPTHSTD